MVSREARGSVSRAGPAGSRNTSGESGFRNETEPALLGWLSNPGSGETIRKEGQKGLGSLIHPLQILEYNDLRAHFGLGQSNRAERLEIRWPSGAIEVVDNLPANHVFTVREGKGVVSRVPFRR